MVNIKPPVCTLLVQVGSRPPVAVGTFTVAPGADLDGVAMPSIADALEEAARQLRQFPEQ